MILASPSGLLCVVKLTRETDRAWIIQYVGERKKETRVPKSGSRKMFDRVSEAEHWVFNRGVE